MEEIKWIYEPMEAQLFGSCDCVTEGPDINNPVCKYVTDHLVTCLLYTSPSPRD